MGREERLRRRRELDALQKQQNRKNFACQGAGKLTGLGVLLHNSQCCSASLSHTHPTMFYIRPSNLRQAGKPAGSMALFIHSVSSQSYKTLTKVHLRIHFP